MTVQCAWTADVSAYLLGALPEAEQQALAHHLDHCTPCQQAVAQLEYAAAVLPLAVEHRQPPPELKSSLMATVRAEAELLRAAGPEADRVPRRAPARRSFLPRIVAPITVGLAVLVLGVFGIRSWTADDPTTQQTIEATVRLPEGAARVNVTEPGQGRLVLDGVPPPPSGYVYEMWLSRAGEAPVPAGTIARVATDRPTTAEIDGDLRSAPSLLVTVERAPGVDTPTVKPVIEARLS